MDAFLADTVVVVHLGVVVFMIGGLVLIVVGGLRRWDWVRNPWFRGVHALVMVSIALDIARDERCCLTNMEYTLRARAGQSYNQSDSFVGRIARDLLYFELPGPSIDALHLAFGALVAISLLAVRPRLRRSR